MGSEVPFATSLLTERHLLLLTSLLPASDKTFYGAHGVDTGAPDGHCAGRRCPPAPGVRCAGFVGCRRGWYWLLPSLAPRADGQRRGPGALGRGARHRG